MKKKINRLNELISSMVHSGRALACSVPGPMVATYVLSLAYMNFFAIKEFPIGRIAVIDCAFLLSWAPFLIADILIKLFGVRAAVSMSIFGASCNATFSLLLWFVTKIPSSFGGFNGTYDIQLAVEEILGSHILIILGSAIALILSTIVKGMTLKAIDKRSKDPSSITILYREVAISSFVGQLFDNTIFAFFTAFLLFHWHISTIIVSIIIKTGIELFMEMTCLPLGYVAITQWKEDGIGEMYINYIKQYDEENSIKD